MNDPIIQLSAGDFPELTAFLANAFAKAQPDYFQTHLSAIYQPTDRHMRCNYAIRRGGAIAGVIGLFPITLHMGSSSLRVAGIGGVSTDPQYRGQGLMSNLMSHVLQQIRQEGYDLSWLSGLRHRYRYFGWEKAGSATFIHAGPPVVDWWRQEHDLPAIRLEPLKEDDAAVLAHLQALQQSQLIYCKRPAEDFSRFLRFHKYQPHVAWDAAGQVAGYITGREGGGDASLVARDASTAAAMACAWVENSKTAGAFQWHTLPDPIGRTLADMSEYISTSGSGNWQIFNWPKVLTTLLRERHAASPLQPGSVAVGINDAKLVVRLTVDGTNATCATTSDKPDITADAPTVTRLLLGPLSPSRVLPLPAAAAILDAWCPLPLWLPPEDHV